MKYKTQTSNMYGFITHNTNNRYAIKINTVTKTCNLYPGKHFAFRSFVARNEVVLYTRCQFVCDK